MTKFTDGPAAGKVLDIRRAPFFLRVTVDKATGEVDALDQLDDSPRLNEAVHVYVLVRNDGGAFVDWTDKKTGRRRGSYQVMATYHLYENQPTGDVILPEVMRDGSVQRNLFGE